MPRNTRDLVCRPSLAGGDHDEKLHYGIINLGAAGLDDEDVFLADAGEYTDTRLAL